jgi:hypothetical protein
MRSSGRLKLKRRKKMTITIGLWIIPTLLTLVMLAMMLRPNPDRGDFIDLTTVFRVLWLIPIMAVWVIYLGARVIFG